MKNIKSRKKSKQCFVMIDWNHGILGLLDICARCLRKRSLFSDAEDVGRDGVCSCISSR